MELGSRFSAVRVCSLTLDEPLQLAPDEVVIDVYAAGVGCRPKGNWIDRLPVSDRFRLTLPEPELAYLARGVARPSPPSAGSPDDEGAGGG
jgi:hypothetical protein